MKALVCSVCGYVHLQDVAPDKCPVCGAPAKVFSLNDEALKTKDDVVTIGESEKKHLPSITIIPSMQQCNEVRVKVGEITHPMTPEHFITRIVFYADRKFLGCTSLTSELNPAASICMKTVEGKKISVVAQCNIHGNWISEI